MILLSVTATRASDFHSGARRSGLGDWMRRLVLSVSRPVNPYSFKPMHMKGVPDVIWSRHSALILSREQYRKHQK